MSTEDWWSCRILGKMKIAEPEYSERKKYFEARLTQNNKIKLKLIWAGLVTIVGSFLIPFMKAGNRWSRETFSSTIGYWNSVLLFGGFLIPIMSYLIYQEYKKMKRTKFDIERELRLLEKEFHKQ